MKVSISKSLFYWTFISSVSAEFNRVSVNQFKIAVFQIRSIILFILGGEKKPSFKSRIVLDVKNQLLKTYISNVALCKSEM